MNRANSARQIYWIAFVSVTNMENASTQNAGRTTRRVHDDAGNLIETHAHRAILKSSEHYTWTKSPRAERDG